MFVPHGQKLAVRQKKWDLHQLFMHFQREAITASTLWPNGRGQDELIGQAGARKRNFGVVNIKALTQEEPNDCSHNGSRLMNGLVRLMGLWKELLCEVRSRLEGGKGECSHNRGMNGLVRQGADVGRNLGFE